VIVVSALSNKTATRYAELQVTTNFSFLRGASHGEELVAQAHALGIAAIAVTDRNTLAGVVRAHVAAKEVGLKLIVGARLDLQDAPSLLCLPRDRQAYGRLSRLISEGQMRAKKGACTLDLEDVARHAEGQIFIALAPGDWGWRVLSSERAAREAPLTADIIPFRLKGSPLISPSPLMGEGGGGADTSTVVDTPLPNPPPQGGREKRKRTTDARSFEAELRRMKAALGDSPLYLAGSHTYRGDDRARIAALAMLAKRCGTPLVATGDVLYHAPQRRELQDVLTCVREKTTIREAGFKLAANAERHLKAPREMARLFRGHEDAILRTMEIAEGCRFSLDDLKYEYPDEPIPPGKTPQGHLEDLTWEGARWRFPGGIPGKVRGLIERELALIDQLGYAQYFLTVHDIVRFARSRGILCQGRGSAANSAVCYCLAVTAVNPTEIDVLFERFISPERREPPDIDVDFEHERREEVIQYIYARYGRDRAGLAATVISYRARSAVRDVGKAMGLSEDTVSALSGMVWGTSSGGTLPEKHVRAAGLDPKDKLLATVLELAHELMGFPRHLSQHVGGFVLTRGPLIEVVPVGNAAMEDRTFIEWDKDDIAALGLLKVDVLALGMLTCIRKAFDLIAQHEGKALTLATVPREDGAVYDMLCKADSVGVFQVESRAQMNMLPRLKPRCFYDLVIEVAIVRPGPIQGDMVHPYLRRRGGLEPEYYPSPAPQHGDKDELKDILGKTKGVPLFQEQAMRIALVAAKFSDAEVNELRKAMATFRRRGSIGLLEEKMVSRMTARGYDKAFAQRCFNQIKGFGEYGFPESHAASFAHLVYVSSWIKCHHPAAFAAALLNSQPMGFYAPAQIVRDAREHGVEVRGADVNLSDWDCTLEKGGTDGRPAMRLGLRQVDGLQEEEIKKLVAARASSPGACAETCVDGRLGSHTDALQTMSSRGLSPQAEAPAVSWIPATSAGTTVVAAMKPFRDVHDVWARARVKLITLEKLAAADAFRSVGRDRRQALWEVKALSAAEPLPLFIWSETREAATEPFVQLPQMRLSEHVVNDYQMLRLSLKAHPMSFVREQFTARRVVSCDELRGIRDGAWVAVAGVVLVRQRPGSAKGVVFMTVEDETGIANAVIWAKQLERFRKEVMASRLIVIHGRVQRHEDIIHVVASRLEDRSDWLQLLSADAADMKVPVANADHVVHADSRSPPEGKFPADANANKMHPRWATHPRYQRIIPKSRDFH
jgi:error-prone DNA polymerase